MRFAMLAVLIVVVAFLLVTGARTPAPVVVHQAHDYDADLIALRAYSQWQLVNPKRELMEPLPAMSCIRIAGRQEGSPHLNKYISVYVNPVGRDAMMSQREPKFPEGSMIVKEKFDGADAKKPEMLTAMIKRSKGFNPESGDWEYFVLDGAASQIDERGKLERCSTCHQPYQYSDFVTRTYVPTAVRMKMK
jgi:hypothetical protein